MRILTNNYQDCETSGARVRDFCRNHDLVPSILRAVSEAEYTERWGLKRLQRTNRDRAMSKFVIKQLNTIETVFGASLLL